MNSQVNDQNFEEWNEKMSIKFDPDKYHKSKNPIIRFIEYRRTKMVVELLNAQHDDTVIELGCGAGNILQKINAKEPWGVDLSDYLLNKAKKILPNAKLFKGNVESLPDEIKQQKFAKIYSSEVIEHTLHPEKLIDEIASIATTDSTIVISIPNEKIIEQIKTIFRKLNIFKLLFPSIQNKATEEWHLHIFDLGELKRITLGKLYVKKIKAAPFSFLPIRYIVLFKKIK